MGSKRSIKTRLFLDLQSELRLGVVIFQTFAEEHQSKITLQGNEVVNGNEEEDEIRPLQALCSIYYFYNF